MIWTALVLGFLGSFHCLGMCGPIALAVSAAGKRNYWINKLLYNLGRTMTYGLLGWFMGMLGWGLQLAGFQQGLSILLGGTIIIFALLYKKSEKALAGGGIYGLAAKVKSFLGFWLKKGSLSAFFMIGMVNGILPCGMVYIALLASLALSDPLLGSLYMIVFGLGTVPLLFLLMIGSDFLSPRLRYRFFKLMPYFAVFIGMLFIVRGMGLGAHFLSPELNAISPAEEMSVCY